jgi:transposase
MMRPTIYPVQVKTKEQQDIQAIHRVRSEINSHRVAKGNQIRGLVCEYGLVAPKELASLRQAIPVWLDDTSETLTPCFKQLLRSLWDDLMYLDERMKELNAQIKQIAQNNPVTKRLKQLQGVGDLVSTALVAHIGDAKQFRKGRDMAAALGLTPKQHSSGGKEKLLGISKRGNSYLRFLLIQGARSAMRTAKGKDYRFSRWVASLQGRRHPNVVVVAMANKIVRMAWAMMTKGTDYDPNYQTV